MKEGQPKRSFLPIALSSLLAAYSCLSRPASSEKSANLDTSPQDPIATLYNPITNTYYEIVPGPVTNVGNCVKLGEFSTREGEKYTVFGAATVLGPEPQEYSDQEFIEVYYPDGSLMGKFSTREMPNSMMYTIVPQGTIVCEGNSNS